MNENTYPKGCLIWCSFLEHSFPNQWSLILKHSDSFLLFILQKFPWKYDLAHSAVQSQLVYLVKVDIVQSPGVIHLNFCICILTVRTSWRVQLYIHKHSTSQSHKFAHQSQNSGDQNQSKITSHCIISNRSTKLTVCRSKRK